MPTLSLHFTDLCNSRCTFCVVGAPRLTCESIDYSQIVETLETNAGHCDHVNLHGGEPTIHPHFFDLLERAKSLGYQGVDVQTNGMSLADMAFTQRAVDAGVKLFIVSLHGDTSELHDGQTNVPGGFEKTLQGVRNAVKAGARVRTNTVISNQSLTRLKSIAELAISLGVSHINFSNMHPVGSAQDVLSSVLPFFSDVRPPLYQAVDKCLELNVTVTLEGFPFCSVPEKRLHCLERTNRGIRMVIRGNVIPNYDDFMKHTMRSHGTVCNGCTERSLCGGVYPEYAAYRGWEEFSAIPH